MANTPSQLDRIEKLLGDIVLLLSAQLIEIKEIEQKLEQQAQPARSRRAA